MRGRSLHSMTEKGYILAKVPFHFSLTLIVCMQKKLNYEIIYGWWTSKRFQNGRPL